MQFYHHKPFPKSLQALWKKGGAFQKAATEIEALLGRITTGSADGSDNPLKALKATKTGESRIRHCIKYDLQGFSRLITVQNDGYCILLYCGDHEDCDRWLNEHQGLEFLIDGLKQVVPTYRSTGEGEKNRVHAPAGHDPAPLYSRLPDDMYEELVSLIPRKVCRELERLDSTVKEPELWTIIAEVTDSELRTVIYDVFVQLRADRVDQAVARIKLHWGEVQPIDEIQVEALPDLIDGDVLRRIPVDSPNYSAALRRFMRGAGYRDWMLFMHADQEKIANEDFDGPAKLVGVSGSGKTCIVVRRAVRLAEKYPGDQVLILTLNKALARLIGELVTACASEGVRNRIHVRPMFALCQELMLSFNPSASKLYNEVTWKSDEHVDEIWQEFYRCGANNRDASVLQPVHDSLLAQGWNAERYLREEVDWIRSALFPDVRERYLGILRTGRKVILQSASRQSILAGVQAWEEKMEVIGVTDALGLAQALAAERPFIKPAYRCILVDELQDFGNVELEIVRALVSPAENDLFLTGDAAQAVTAKHQRLREVRINIPASRSRRLAKNYRNTADVLGAAYAVFMNNLSEDLMNRDDLDIMDPELSVVSGTTPLLLGSRNLADEMKGAIALCRDRLSTEPDAKCCIAVCGFSHFELSKYGSRLTLPVLDGTASLDHSGLFLSDLAHTKGFEFDLMCIVNCSLGVLPDPTAPQEEQYRELAMLYVAMTRAKLDLVLSYSGAKSPLLGGSEDKFLADEWSRYLSDFDLLPTCVVPERIDWFSENGQSKPWEEMTGNEFLYTDWAVGVSLELSSKLRSLVDGRGLRKSGQPLKWKTLGRALDSFNSSPQARNLWGPEVGRQLIELAARLRLTAEGSTRPAQSSAHSLQ